MPDTLIAGGRAAATDETSYEATHVPAASALESRAEVASLAELQQERRTLIAQNAGLIARYGNFGMHDDYRKRMVEAMKVKARMDLSVGREKKPTEGEIDATAYGSDEYQRFLDNALDEKVQYLNVQTRIDELNEQIRSRELEIMSYNAEVRLAR